MIIKSILIVINLRVLKKRRKKITIKNVQKIIIKTRNDSFILTLLKIKFILFYEYYL
jgi:hypothetical protein